jgi:oligopeptide transport system substrate-binding protein
MPGKRPPRMAAGVAAIVALTAGCTSDWSSGPDVAPNTIVVGIAEPQHLMPANTTDASGTQVLASLFAPLVDFDANHQPHPVAAQSITPDRTNEVWTITLKPGFTFSNGEPVTADSYINAWNYGAYGPNGQSASSLFDRIEGYAELQSRDPDGVTGPQEGPAPRARTLSGLKKIDDTTFTVTLSAPFVGWAAVLGSAAFYPLPKAAFSAPGVIADGFEDAIIGNGPFKMKGRWEHGDQIRVEKVAHFKGTVPGIDGVTWKIYKDPRDEYADLVAGKVDVQPKIPVEDLATAAGDLGDRLQKSPNSSFTFVAFPAFQPEFAKPQVRQALSMAVNRKVMTDQILQGAETPANAFVSPAVAGYRPGSCGEACTFDPTKAKAMYAAAGGPRDITITYNADGGHKAWVDEMCRQITASLGINCKGASVPNLADMLTAVEKRRPVGLFRLNWTMDYPLMESYLGPLYSTNGSSNVYGYSNPAFDSLLKQGATAATPEEATRKWQQAEDILAHDIPVIPLRFGQNVYGHSERVSKVTVDASQKLDLDRIQVVE